MVYLDSWWPYILVAISFVTFFLILIVLCRHRLQFCPPSNYDNGYPPDCDSRRSSRHRPPSGTSSASNAQDPRVGSFHIMAEVSVSAGGSPVDVIILPPPYSDQAPPSYSEAIKTVEGGRQRNAMSDSATGRR